MPLNPTAFPLGPPTIAGNLISIDTMLNQPTRITRLISDITAQRFIADRVFATGGGVTGGAVIYDQATQNELYGNRDVEQVAPGQEFPITSSDRLTPRVALVEKWGAKFFITDEARARNDAAAFRNEANKLANTVVRKLNARTIETLEASIAESGQTTAGHLWSTFNLEGSTPTTPANRPTADFAKALLLSEQQELGVVYDLWLLNPADYINLVIGYGDKLDAVLRSSGIEFYWSNRVTAGTAYAVASGQVGQMRVEQPLATESWREPDTQRTWVQTSVRPVMFVDNPYAVLKFTGLA